MNVKQKFYILIVLIINFYFLFIIYNYWKADVLYNRSEFEKALSITPDEPNYISKLSLSNNNVEMALRAFNLNQYNQNSRRILISNLVKNSGEKSDNLLIAEKIILDGIQKSPNDPKLYYQLGILELKIGKNSEAISSLQKSVNLKPNYKEGRFALGSTYKALNENEKAKEQFDYIVKNIDPNDELTKKYLDEL